VCCDNEIARLPALLKKFDWILGRVGGKIFDSNSDVSKISNSRLLNIEGMNFDC